MTETMIHAHLTPDLIRDALQAAGYRVESETGPDGEPLLRSATAGVGFVVLFPQPPGAPAAGLGFADAAFRAVFRVEGALPLDLVNRWNVSHRFARLGVKDGMLVFDLDLLAAGGITPVALATQVTLWDRLVQMLVVHLRDELARLPALAAGDQPMIPAATGAAA